MNYPSYLIHYGVKGQHWGERKYQYEDGTYTPLGKERRRIGSKKYRKPLKIKKGKIVYRGVRNGSSGFINREYSYFNITDDFSKHSKAVSEGFDGEINSTYVLKIKKDLKIATIYDYFYEMCDVLNIDTNMYIKDIPNDNDISLIISKLPHKYIEGTGGNYEIFNKIVNNLKDKKYDGFIDPIDGSFNDDKGLIPAVIFNPKENLEIIDFYDF